MLAEARKANPGNLNLLILSGVAARMQKKMKPAEDYFVEAHGIAPGNGDVINQLALLLIEQADPGKARSRAAVRQHERAAEQSERRCADHAGLGAVPAWAQRAMPNGAAQRPAAGQSSARTAATWSRKILVEQNQRGYGEADSAERA